MSNDPGELKMHSHHPLNQTPPHTYRHWHSHSFIYWSSLRDRAKYKNRHTFRSKSYVERQKERLTNRSENRVTQRKTDCVLREVTSYIQLPQHPASDTWPDSDIKQKLWQSGYSDTLTYVCFDDNRGNLRVLLNSDPWTKFHSFLDACT